MRRCHLVTQQVLSVSCSCHTAERHAIPEAIVAVNDTRQLTCGVIVSALGTCARQARMVHCSFCLDRRHHGVDILRYGITAVHETTRHILTEARVTFDRHEIRLRDRRGGFSHRRLHMRRFLRRDDRRAAAKHEVNTQVVHQILVELNDIHLQSSVETKRCRQ